MCALAYEKFCKVSKEVNKKPKRITILEKKKNLEAINNVSVNLYEDEFKKEKFKINININFIEISKLIEQNKIKLKEWEKYIELNKEKILMIGCENLY